MLPCLCQVDIREWGCPVCGFTPKSQFHRYIPYRNLINSFTTAILFYQVLDTDPTAVISGISPIKISTTYQIHFLPLFISILWFPEISTILLLNIQKELSFRVIRNRIHYLIHSFSDIAYLFRGP